MRPSIEKTEKKKSVTAVVKEESSKETREEWIEREIKKLEYGSYISTDLKESIQSYLRSSTPDVNVYGFWFSETNSMNKSYFITIDRTGKVTRIDTNLFPKP